MKKLIAMLLALAMVLSFAACSNDEEPADDDNNQSNVEVENPDEGDEDEATYTLGMGVVVNTGSTTDGNAQVDATVAVVVLDAEGKIVDVEIDCAQTVLNTTEFPADLTTVDVRSKAEKKEDYGMAAIMGVPEWYVQVDALEEVLVGMTGEEVAAIELVESNGHMVATDETIYAACTMNMTDFVEAVTKACNDEYAKEFTASEWNLGLGVNTSVLESTAATADANGTAALYTNFAGVVLDAEGKVIVALCDMIQPTVDFDATGAIVAVKEDLRTKKELKEDYGMAAIMNVPEWYVQAKAFEDFIVGLTGEEVAGIETTTNEHDYVVAADETLYAGCTIQISEFMSTVAKACTNA